jgi:hypothetical protein
MQRVIMHSDIYQRNLKQNATSDHALWHLETLTDGSCANKYTCFRVLNESQTEDIEGGCCTQIELMGQQTR